MFDNPCERSTYQASELRLPRVSIEQFGGDYAKWQSFQDQFESSIHSKDHLSNIHKFQYLKSLLKNEAASLIRHMAMTDANYMLAWEKLKKRYDKKKYSVRELIDMFLNQPTANAEGYKQLRTLCDTSDEVLRGLQALGSEWEGRDPWLIHIVMKKLDMETQQAWAKHSIDIDVPTINGLLDFLSDRCDALETCTATKRPNTNRQHPKTHTVTAGLNNCALCNTNNHPLFKCFKFKKRDLVERLNFVKTNSLCQNCLSLNHETNSCKSRNRCFTCGNKHHTLLHQDPANSNTSQSVTTQQLSNNKKLSNYVATCNSTINKDSNLSTINDDLNLSSINTSTSINNEATCAHSSTTYQATSTNSQVNTLLSTAVFYVLDEFGNTHTARGLLDSGSQATLISESCVKRVGLHRSKSNVTVNGLASQKAGITKGAVQLHLQSKMEPESNIIVNALILNNLTSRLPTNKFDNTHWPLLNNLNLADPTFNIPGVIDIILGNDAFYEILLSEKLKITDHLFAQSTIFGWVLGGQIANSTAVDQPRSFHTTISNNDSEMELLNRFWEVEQIDCPTMQNSPEDESELHYKQNTTKADDGRYIVKLPFKLPRENLGSTYNQALRRFLLLEKKLANDPKLKQEYTEFVTEYKTLGHMDEIETRNNSPNPFQTRYHLPHHCVIKSSSSTTKLRVVFDGSCKSTTGYSLNDMLLVGPTIQDDLTVILLRFRLNKIAISADIEKMYRQILIHPNDRDLQRILWRDSPNEAVQQFHLTTVTYGTSSAPFLACRTLHQLADDNIDLLPDAAIRLKSSFYVDDMLTGCHDSAEAIQIYNDMSTLVKRGGFKLRKWMTNDPVLATHIPESERETKFLEFDGVSLVKTLGLFWNPQNDCFNFRVTLNEKPNLTKRTLLSECCRIFDPLGWLSPCTILIKILFQQLWLRHLNWDD